MTARACGSILLSHFKHLTYLRIFRAAIASNSCNDRDRLSERNSCHPVGITEGRSTVQIFSLESKPNLLDKFGFPSQLDTAEPSPNYFSRRTEKLPIELYLPTRRIPQRSTLPVCIFGEARPSQAKCGRAAQKMQRLQLWRAHCYALKHVACRMFPIWWIFLAWARF